MDILIQIFAMPIERTHHLRALIKRHKPQDQGFTRTLKEVMTLMKEHYEIVWKRRRRIHRVLRDFGVNDQRSAEWHLKRSEMITASEVAKAYTSPSARHELIMRKLVGKMPGDDDRPGALIWGTRMEPLAKKIYETIHGVNIVDTSCVQHPVHKFLGASPDGIIMPADPMDTRWGTLIEFKCPISRKFDDTTPVPDSYYHQMQMQMECTGVDKCEYVEMQFRVVTSGVWEKDTSKFKGVFVTFDDGYTFYKESSLSECGINEWKKNDVLPLVDKHGEYRLQYWIMPFHREFSVQKDPDWLPNHIGPLTEVWDEVLHHRAAGTLPGTASAKPATTITLEL